MLYEVITYAYDGIGRLLSVSGGQSQSFGYDAIGNMTSNSQVGGYTYGDSVHKHAVTKAGSSDYTYDAAGNIVITSYSIHYTKLYEKLVHNPDQFLLQVQKSRHPNVEQYITLPHASLHV